MIPIQHFIWKIHVAALCAFLLYMLSGCAASGDSVGGIIGDLLGVQVTTDQRSNIRNDYVYYPRYDVYYNRNTSEFISEENGRWVSRQSPRNATAQQVLRSGSVSIDGYDSPAHHRSALARQNARYGYSANEWERENPRNPYDQDRTYRRY